jgi:hypothetical protein
VTGKEGEAQREAGREAYLVSNVLVGYWLYVIVRHYRSAVLTVEIPVGMMKRGRREKYRGEEREKERESKREGESKREKDGERERERKREGERKKERE